jgi:prephenate dehydratase
MITIAYLGPAGTYSEAAALLYADHWRTVNGKIHNALPDSGSDSKTNSKNKSKTKSTSYTSGNTSPLPELKLLPCNTIPQAINAVAQGQCQLAIVPAENSIQGGVTMTLDTLWQKDHLKIEQALEIAINHALITQATDLSQIQTVYSHPQGLAQCQQWLHDHLPHVHQISTDSTTEGLQFVKTDNHAAVISSQRAADLYGLPVLACPINDHPENCTRFWVLTHSQATNGLDPKYGDKYGDLHHALDDQPSHTSLAFSLPRNCPGALVKALSLMAERGLNLSRIESRPTKRSLGEYIFFADIEAATTDPNCQAALEELATVTETLKVFGSYHILDAT